MFLAPHADSRNLNARAQFALGALLRSLCLLILCSCGLSGPINLSAADNLFGPPPVSGGPTNAAPYFSTNNTPNASITSPAKAGAVTNIPSTFVVSNYQVKGETLLPTNTLNTIFAKYTGTNVSLEQIAKAARDVQEEYRTQGHPFMSVGIAPHLITNGTVTLNVFRGILPEVLVAGKRYLSSSDQAALSSQGLAVSPSGPANALGAAAANAPSAASTNAQAATASTNSGPSFLVTSYEIKGDTLLNDDTLASILGPYTGTNITVNDIVKAASDLQLEYRNRGYPTVNVTLPPQQITNGIVRIRVFVGRLSDIQITGNRFFSSNNVMRSLPSLETNIIISSPVFQAELDRANANQDRQIYPQISPGPEENTTSLRLDVKENFPLHAKVELNNQSSPGTPDLRLNSSAVYNNLWQFEHSLGVQYNFSPQEFKPGDQWKFYDRPQVVNYSGFYSLPLADHQSYEDIISTQPGSFGYDEATRKFRLPPPSNRPELNIYGSRSTIDTGVMNLFTQNLYNTNGNRLDRSDIQQDLTINNNIGARLSFPLTATANFQSAFSGGVDFKSYDLTSFKTNVFTITTVQIDNTSGGTPKTNIIVSVDNSPVPTTHHEVNYLPFAFRWNGTLQQTSSITAFSLGFSGNGWISGTKTNFQNTVGSKNASGHWISLNPTLSHEQTIYKDWKLALRADGQWASEPLLSNEQFGLGGINSVRGYHEGQVFGDTGWHIGIEQKTPPHVVGLAYNKTPLTLRGSVYMDYGEVYLLDPRGRQDRTRLWGVGFGGVAAVGPHWEGRLFFSWPLEQTATTEPGQPRFDFSLSAQF